MLVLDSCWGCERYSSLILLSTIRAFGRLVSLVSGVLGLCRALSGGRFLVEVILGISGHLKAPLMNYRRAVGASNYLMNVRVEGPLVVAVTTLILVMPISALGLLGVAKVTRVCTVLRFILVVPLH